MKFGLMSANLMGNVEGIAAGELARTAEEVGFHSIWAVEHAVVPVEYASTYPYDEGGRLFKGTSQLTIPIHSYGWLSLRQLQPISVSPPGY